MVATNLRASLNYLILIQNAATKKDRLISYEIPLVVWLRVDNFLSLVSHERLSRQSDQGKYEPINYFLVKLLIFEFFTIVAGLALVFTIPNARVSQHISILYFTE